MGLNVSALPEYISQTTGRIVLDTVFVGTSAEYFESQEGIKHAETLNLISTTPYFQGGNAVSSVSGSTVLSQRTIEVTPRTAFDGFNLQLLNDKYAGKMGLPEGSYEESFAMMDAITGDLVRKAQQQNDLFIWTAESGSQFPGSSVTPAVDGIKGLISGSTSGVNVPAASQTGSAEFGAAITAANAYDQLVDGLELLDDNIKAADDLTIWCGPGVFTKIASGFTKQNLFHFDPTSIERRNGMYEVALPGFPNVKVVGTYGLTGSDRIVIGPDSDMVIGTDLVSDTENFKLWFSMDDDQIKYRLRNKLGVQVGHPAYWASNDLA
jgi:hypothetical protein